MRGPYQQAVVESGVLVALAAFDPHVAGTPPLGIDIETSDIDILCTFTDAEAFAAAVVCAFGGMDGFTLYQWHAAPRAIIARFLAAGWEFEIFAESTAVTQQVGWRHFLVERQLVQMGGEPLRASVIEAKRRGLKTEPAFAQVLGLKGDPYQALLALEPLQEEALRRLLRRAGL